MSEAAPNRALVPELALCNEARRYLGNISIPKDRLALSTLDLPVFSDLLPLFSGGGWALRCSQRGLDGVEALGPLPPIGRGGV